MIEFNKKNSRLWSIMGINPSIWSIGFSEVAKNKEDVAVFTADLERYSGLERTFLNYTNKCFNLGIAEQNMVGIAAGMSMEGTQTYMTTYAPFMSLRCADQMRHLMGNLNLDMKAVGSAAGLTAGLSGASLLAINDIALTRSIPNMIVLSPADCTEAVKMMVAMSKNCHPTYMRFCGNVRIPVVYEEDYEFEIGKAVTLAKGGDIAMIATGTNVVSETIKAAQIIEEKIGIHPTVIDMHTIKPLDKVCLDHLIKNHDFIVTIEEHNIIGGMGAAVSEHLATISKPYKQIFIGIEDKNYVMGSRPYMLEQSGLTAEKIAERICLER